MSLIWAYFSWGQSSYMEIRGEGRLLSNGKILGEKNPEDQWLKTYQKTLLNFPVENLPFHIYMNIYEIYINILVSYYFFY